MNIEIHQEKLDQLPAHGQVSIAFQVRSVLDLTVIDSGLGGLGLRERELTSPYIKNYDGIAGNAPCEWGQQFDMAQWSLFASSPF